MLRMKGYEVTPRYDKGKKLVGYTIGKNASIFKASEIGRRFMASQLEATWKKFHPEPSQVRMKPSAPTISKAVEIPNLVKDIFLNEAQVPEDNDTATVEIVAHTAMLFFVGYIDAATSMSESCGGGGGSSPESDWGKKDDEDERAFIRRCLKMAYSICKPKPRQRSFHR